MRNVVALLLVGLLSCPVLAADPALAIPEGSASSHSPAASPPGVLTASAAREVDRLVRSTALEPRKAQPFQQPNKRKGWIARHPRLFGALIGFGVGCVVGSSQVGGSDDNFFNALDEFACPV